MVSPTVESDDSNGAEMSYAPRLEDIQLVIQASNGNLEKVKQLLDDDADPCYQDIESGMSVLMAAAGSGHVEVVEYLLSEGAPWNAVDRKYLCAGDYAARNGHQKCIDVLMNHACMSELILSKCIDNEDFEASRIECQVDPNKTEKPTVMNAAYLKSTLEYSEDGKRLTENDTSLAVMMDWEQPLMKKHAAFICHDDVPVDSKQKGIKVLNVGFGMGIVDGEIQKFHPKEHYVIEAHDKVIEEIKKRKFDKIDGVKIVKGRWQDAVKTLVQEIENGAEPFDGIFFDTYAEDDRDLRQFHDYLPKLLKRNGGRYSYYNGLCPDNVFFHGVACETMKLLLNQLGLSCDFEPFPVDVSDPSLWKDLSSRYWYFDTYYLPKCVMS